VVSCRHGVAAAAGAVDINTFVCAAVGGRFAPTPL
jgi:hypothetical protein